MKIVRLEINNIGGIEAFELDANGDHVVLGGPNAAGKSSVLRAIASALGGGRNRLQERWRNVAARTGRWVGQIQIDGGIANWDIG